MSRSVAFVALVATGCASIAPQRGHDEVAKLVRDRTGESTGWEQGPAADDATHQRVTELLQGGLDPRRAVAIALLHNPRLLATYEELGISQADLVQAGLLKNPSFSVAAGWPVSGGRIVEQQFSLVQDFLDLFVLPLRRDLAAEQFAGDVARVAHEAYAVATETLAAFITCQAAAKNVELRTTLLEAQVASLTLAERQFEAGNITELALTTERAVAAQARLDVSVAEQALFASREAVNRALGLFGPQTDWGLRAELSDLPEADPSLEHLETLAMHQRLDVAAARRQVRVFERALELTRTWRWVGRLEVGIDTHQDPNGPRLLGPSLVIELPLFDQRQAAVAKLEAQTRQAQRRLDALAVDARSEVRVAAVGLTAARQRAHHVRTQVLPLRQRAFELTQQQYNAMQVGLAGLVIARQQHLDALNTALDALKDYWLARVRLGAAVGTDFTLLTKGSP